MLENCSLVYPQANIRAKANEKRVGRYPSHVEDIVQRISDHQIRLLHCEVSLNLFCSF